MGRRGDAAVADAEYAFDLFVIFAAEDADFVRGYLLPALDLPPSRVQLIDDLPPGATIVSEIDRRISHSRFTIAVLSPAYLQDRWTAFGEQLASHLSAGEARVIPLRLIDCQLPLRLEARVALDFTEPVRWEPEVARLRDLLRTTAPVAEHIACPYPGMRAFDTREASQFFGRDREIDDVLGRLDRGEREIYVIGPSGSGKSSLVQAGLRHALEAGGSRLARSFAVRTMRPGERPCDRLAEVLEGDPSAPVATLGALLARHPPAERILVFIDQLEELFTLADTAERRRFIATLGGLRAEPRCYLLLALRADFFGALMDSALWPTRSELSRLDVAPLRGEALVQAITRPAARVGVYLEPRLCDRLVADAAAEPGALPLVQETLRQLWDRRRQRFLGLAEYEDLGDGGSALHVAIARRADATMRALTGAQRTIARRVLLRLVNFGDGRADTRRQQAVETLQSAADDEAEFSRVLQQLVADRLVTIDRARRAERVLVDLSHESLITGWPALRDWIARRRADEQRRRQLEAKVSEWIEHGSGAVCMFDAVGIAEATQWMQSYAARELGYRTELRTLVAVSRSELDAAQRRRRRALFRTLVVLAAFSVAASIAVLVAQRARQHAQHDLGRIYLEQGRAQLLDGHRTAALPYLVAARAQGIDGPVLQMLFAQASSAVPLVTFRGHRSSVMTAVLSPDGLYVVTAGQDNSARIWDAATGHQVTWLVAHQGPVRAAAWSPDGTRVVTASDDGTARVWNAATGRQVTLPLTHRGPVQAVAWSPDGTRVVTASKDGTARVWNAATGKPLTPPLAHRDEVLAAAFSPHGTSVVTASKDGTAQIWDASTGQPLIPRPLNNTRAAAFSPDGTSVVTASSDGTARIWDASTGQPLPPPLLHRAQVNSVAFSPDGTSVVTASSDGTARVWSASTGQPLTPPLPHRAQVNSAVFSRDSALVVTASDDGTARVWDASSGWPMTPPLPHRGFVSAAAFSPDGTLVVTSSGDRTAQIWSVSSGKPVTPAFEHQGAVYTAAFSADGERVITASFDQTARIWGVPSRALTASPLQHRDFVRGAAFSSDGRRVVTASFDRIARLWDAATGQVVMLEHQGYVHSAAFSPDDRRVVTASQDGTARLWDASTGAPVTPPLRHRDIVWTAAFSPDGTRVVTASQDGTAQVWDASTGAPVTPPLRHTDAVLAAVFSPDGTRVATASQDGTARIWDAVTGAPVTPSLEHRDQVNFAAFSPDGVYLVTASNDATARIWEVATGEPATPPLEQQGSVRTASFSPDGTRVVTASDDRTARVWDLSTGRQVTPPLEHQGPVRTAAFSPDGARVVTASDDTTARVWTLATDAGSLDDWQALARCAPFALVDTVLRANPDPVSACTPGATSSAPR